MGERSQWDRRKGQLNLVGAVPPFVGRREELDWFAHSLQEAMAGHPRVVLMQGEAGVGKTRLLEEVRLLAGRRGMQVCYGRCDEDLALPYLPMVRALLPQLRQLPEALKRDIGPDAEVIGRLFHGTGESLPTASASTAGQADQDKLQLLLAVARTTIKLSQHCPILFVIDDLHWVDRSSLDLFGHLVFTVADTALRESVPLLLIGTHRPMEPGAHLARLLARFQRESICQTLTLATLTEVEIHELIQAMGVVRPSHQLTAAVREATQGNPLFIQEVLHYLVKQDALRERGGYMVTTTAPGDLRLPEHCTVAIAARTQGLSEGCRRALTQASFLGERFSLDMLSAVSRVNEEELLNLLEEGIRQRLLWSEGQAFQFAHPLVRHVFYTEPSVARRQRIHQQIAESLQHLYGSSGDEYLLEIAHHLVRAGPAAGAETVMEYARRAADRAFSLFAWGEAAHYYEAALSASVSIGRLSAHDRAELHYRASLAHFWNQDAGPCLDHCEKAIESYRLTGDLRGLAQALMRKTATRYTLASVPLGSLIEVEPLEDVLEALGDREPGLCGRILAIMAEVFRNARQTARAKEMAQQALELGQRLQDHELCARASSALALAHIQSLQLTDALESWQSALLSARRANDLILQGWPLQRMPLALTLQGRLDEAEAIAIEACALARNTHDWGNSSVALSHLASIAVAKGDFAAAEQYAHETMLMVYRSGYPWGGFRALCALACARALRGAWAEAADALDMLVEPGLVFVEAGPVIQAFVRAFRRWLQEYSAAADAALEPFANDLMQAVGTDTYSLAPLCALVELADRRAAPGIAELPCPALARAAEGGVRFSSGWMCLLPRVLGVAASLNRRWETAEASFQAAIQIATEAGARPELGRTYLDYARMLAARGGGSDRRRAIELLREATPMFQDLGMEPFLRQTAQLAGTLRSRVALMPQPYTVSPNDLNAQEVAILRQIAHGRSDQEIAGDLVLSSQTIAGHIGRIFDKIGVDGRQAAAAYTFDKNLATQSLQTILITDMEGSTALTERLGDAKAHALLQTHNRIIRDTLGTHQGFEVTHTGDGIEASFASASHAVQCAIAIQQAFARYNQAHPDGSMRVRIGIHAGEPIPTEGRLFGAAVHTAFRICTHARPGQILVSDVIQQLVTGKGFTLADRGRVALKGLKGRLRLHQVQWEDERE